MRWQQLVAAIAGGDHHQRRLAQDFALRIERLPASVMALQLRDLAPALPGDAWLIQQCAHQLRRTYPAGLGMPADGGASIQPGKRAPGCIGGPAPVAAGVDLPAGIRAFEPPLARQADHAIAAFHAVL
ncbi:hypothetical protein D3C71_1545380 [compost metagenome]